MFIVIVIFHSIWFVFVFYNINSIVNSSVIFNTKTTTEWDPTKGVQPKIRKYRCVVKTALGSEIPPFKGKGEGSNQKPENIVV